MTQRTSHRIAILVLVLTLFAGVAKADDKSYSQVIKQIKSSYRAKEQGFFGFMLLARFAVKMIKPAGVKNFKFTMLRDLDFSEAPAPECKEFAGFISNRIDPGWIPLVEYRSPRERQWTYVYTRQENDDLKLLVVTVQQKEAFVLQAKFNPAKLAEFMNNPTIMGISLKDDKKQKQITFNPTELALISQARLS